MNNKEKYSLVKFAENKAVDFDRESFRSLFNQKSRKHGPAPAYNPAYQKRRNAGIQKGLNAFELSKYKKGMAYARSLPSGPPNDGATAGALAGVPKQPVDSNQLAFNVKSPGNFVPSKPR